MAFFPSVFTFALIRQSSVTQSVNMDQRSALLAEVIAPGQGIDISAPADANLAPPGFYMLFVVSAEGVPSLSTMVQIVPAIPAVFGDRAIDEAHLSKWEGDYGLNAKSNTDGDRDGRRMNGTHIFLVLAIRQWNQISDTAPSN